MTACSVARISPRRKHIACYSEPLGQVAVGASSAFKTNLDRQMRRESVLPFFTSDQGLDFNSSNVDTLKIASRQHFALRKRLVLNHQHPHSSSFFYFFSLITQTPSPHQQI